MPDVSVEAWVLKDDAHHIASAENPQLTLCGQEAVELHTLPAGTTVWPDGNAACWTCWNAARALITDDEKVS